MVLDQFRIVFATFRATATDIQMPQTTTFSTYKAFFTHLSALLFHFVYVLLGRNDFHF